MDRADATYLYGHTGTIVGPGMDDMFSCFVGVDSVTALSQTSRTLHLYWEG
jgi:hypothetical protein